MTAKPLGERVARQDERILPGLAGGASLDGVVDRVEPRPCDRQHVVDPRDDPQQEVHLIVGGRRHREPLDPHQRGAMLAVVHDVGALKCLELVRALVLVDREPQREERVDHRLLTRERRARQLHRDPEPLPVVVVDHLGIAFDRKRHRMLERRRAVAPVALDDAVVLELVLGRLVLVTIIVVVVIVIGAAGQDRGRIGCRVQHLGRRIEDRVDDLGLRVTGLAGLLDWLGGREIEPRDAVDPGLDLVAPQRLEPVLGPGALERGTLPVQLGWGRWQPRRGVPAPLGLRIVELGRLGFELDHARRGEQVPQRALSRSVERLCAAGDHDPAREVAAPRLEAGELH